MNCLCCGKPLLGEKEAGWHKICIKKFFDTRQIPEIEIDEKTLDKLAAESTNSGFTVPGVQRSCHFICFRKITNLNLHW